MRMKPVDSPVVSPTIREVDRAARRSYGRLLAILVARTRDIAAAEDALGQAFVRAMESWPASGVPLNPDAWLLTVARRSLLDRLRASKSEDAVLRRMEWSLEQVQMNMDEMAFEDERLKMLFLCAHPAIEEQVRTPLMLQAVMGIESSRIASAFLVSPAALAQRLVRAKTRIRDSHLEFDLPSSAEFRSRLEGVLACMYAAFTLGWDDIGRRARAEDLMGDAMWLAEQVVELVPREPEAMGLAALMHLSEARRGARRDAGGRYVPLSSQDVSLWDARLIERGEQELHAAAALGRVGRFQLEAAIQSVHCNRARCGVTDWAAVEGLYEQLLHLAPTIGARCGHAAAVLECGKPQEALELLNQLDAKWVAGYQSYWAVRAAVLMRLGSVEEASKAYGRAAGLCDDPSVRQWLLDRRALLSGS